MVFCCLNEITLAKARKKILNHEHSYFVKSLIIQILKDYAKEIMNTIDDELVKEFERRIFEKP